uniref:Uncharacterized protein n=1 Tax=Sphaerodactylus townsendi TaxID=933632 RepID=A0ACB8ECE8_9SAUR
MCSVLPDKNKDKPMIRLDKKKWSATTTSSDHLENSIESDLLRSFRNLPRTEQDAITSRLGELKDKLQDFMIEDSHMETEAINKPPTSSTSPTVGKLVEVQESQEASLNGETLENPTEYEVDLKPPNVLQINLHPISGEKSWAQELKELTSPTYIPHSNFPDLFQQAPDVNNQAQLVRSSIPMVTPKAQTILRNGCILDDVTGDFDKIEQLN